MPGITAKLDQTPSTTILHTPGDIFTLPNGSLYQYVKAAEAIAVYQHVVISTDGHFTILEADTDDTALNGVLVSPAGCAQIAFGSGTYGWLFIGCGAYTGNFATTVALKPLYASATSGVCDDAGVGGKESMLMGCFTLSTGGAAGAAWASGRMYFGGVVA